MPVCKTDLRLSGAVYDTRRPERSFALLQSRPDQAGQVYRVGMSIGSYEIVAIEPRGVLMRNADGECWLRLVGDPIHRARRAAMPPPAPKARPSKSRKKK